MVASLSFGRISLASLTAIAMRASVFCFCCAKQNTLGDTSEIYFVEPQARHVTEAFQQELRRISRAIRARNTSTSILYENLIPSWIPNSKCCWLRWRVVFPTNLKQSMMLSLLPRRLRCGSISSWVSLSFETTDQRVHAKFFFVFLAPPVNFQISSFLIYPCSLSRHIRESTGLIPTEYFRHWVERPALTG